ncbi:hypothetical protein D3C71_2049790 [compost metagenome]
MQHEKTRRFADLQHLIVAFDATEFADLEMRVADDLPIYSDPSLDQQQAHLFAVEAGQVAEEAVNAHGSRKVASGRASYSMGARVA